MRRTRNQRGAVAIMAAITATALLGFAALAVDLGNGLARKRTVQSQADFSALAGGAGLPGAKNSGDPAVGLAADYLLANWTQNDSGNAKPTAAEMRARLVNNDDTDGEAYFPTPNQLRLRAPYRRVTFGLAGALKLQDNFVDVNAEATVGIFTPGGGRAPFFLPKGCTSGPVEIKDSANNNASVVYTPASANGPSVADIDSVSPLTTPGLIASDVQLFGTSFNTTMIADFYQESTGDRIPADPTASIPVTLINDTPSNRFESDEASVSLPPGVFNRPGPWLVRVNNGAGYSRTIGRFIVGNPSPPAAGCGQSSTGDFGMLDSPRVGVTQLNDATALNIAKGLDHDLAVFPGPPYPADNVQDSCNGLGGTPPAGAQNDKISQPGNNCVGIKTGMNVPPVTAGMVSGGTAGGSPFKGLLDAPTTPGCDRNGGSDTKSRIGVNTNDDVLSCFLAPGVTVGSVTATSVPLAAQHSIDPKIFDSPRYGMVVVINYSLNPQNGYYPVLRYQPVFITDESVASTKGTSYATSRNGITLSSPSANKVVALTVIPVNWDALPETAETTGPVSNYIGVGTKVVRLLN